MPQKNGGLTGKPQRNRKRQKPAAAAKTGSHRKAAKGLPENPLAASLSLLFRFIAVAATPTTMLVALLIYFGWNYIQSFYGTFGIDTSILGFSNQDYLFQSIRVCFLSICTALIAALAAVWVHFLIQRILKIRVGENRRWISRWMYWAFIILGLAIALPPYFGFELFLFGSSMEAVWLAQPITFTLGFAFSAYGIYLCELGSSEKNSKSISSSDRRDVSAIRRLSLIMILGLVVVGLFWTSANYAHVLGRYAANDFAEQVPFLPRITICSQEPLGLNGPGVGFQQAGGDSEGFRYCYSGLRFLIRSGGKYFLLPERWTAVDGSAIIVPESNSIRIETAAGEIAH
jgi:hypothetical protein